MAQMNLASDGSGASSIRHHRFGGTLFIPLLILGITFGSYFGAVSYRKYIESRIVAYDQEIEVQRGMIGGEDADRVSDFADRLTVIGDHLGKTIQNPVEFFTKIENAMVPEAVLSSYAYDKESSSLAIELSTDSFKNLVRQMSAFKGVFSSVSLDGEASIGQDGRVVAKVKILL